MVEAKAGAAGAKLSCGQSTERKPAAKRVREGMARGYGSGDGGSGVGGELEGMADAKFIGVRESPRIVEIKNYLGVRSFYKTVKEPNVVAAIIHDLARVHENPSCSDKGLNILEVERCIMEGAQIVHGSIGKRHLVEFTKRYPLKLDDLPDEPFPLKLEGLTKSQFEVLKEQIAKQGRQCFEELKEKITSVQGRQRKFLDTIQPRLAEDDVSQEDDTQALKDRFAEVVAEYAPSNGKLMDAKGEATRIDLITFFKVQLQILEPAQNQREGPEDVELFINPYVPQV